MRADGGQESHVALMREYLRPAALWAKRLEATDHWPFFDVASLITAEVRAEPQSVERLEAALQPFSLWPTIKKTCIWYLHWHRLVQSRPEAVAGYRLPDPFEPLVRFYERGGRFSTKHGFINVDTAGIPAKVRGWQAFDSTTPFVDLDDRALDRLDAVAASTGDTTLRPRCRSQVADNARSSPAGHARRP
jgi:hypothetical protein